MKEPFSYRVMLNAFQENINQDVFSDITSASTTSVCTFFNTDFAIESAISFVFTPAFPAACL